MEGVIYYTLNPNPTMTDELEYFQNIWIEESDEPIKLKEYLNTHRYGELLRIYPREMAPDMDLLAQIQKEYKRGEHPKTGVLECVFADSENRKWIQILTTIEGEPEKVLLNLKYWAFD